MGSLISTGWASGRSGDMEWLGASCREISWKRFLAQEPYHPWGGKLQTLCCLLYVVSTRWAVRCCQWLVANTYVLCHYVHISLLFDTSLSLIKPAQDAFEKSHQPPFFLTGFGHLQMTFLLNLDSETLTARHQTIRIDSLASLLTWVCSNSTWKATEGPENNPTLSYPTSKLFDAFWNRKLNERKCIKNSPTLAWIQQWNENHLQISEKVFEHHNLSHKRNSYGDITYESLIQICQWAMATYVEKCWSNWIISPQSSGWK